MLVILSICNISYFKVFSIHGARVTTFRICDQKVSGNKNQICGSKLNAVENECTRKNKITSKNLLILGFS
jgi:hypothetical protein